MIESKNLQAVLNVTSTLHQQRRLKAREELQARDTLLMTPQKIQPYGSPELHPVVRAMIIMAHSEMLTPEQEAEEPTGGLRNNVEYQLVKISDELTYMTNIEFRDRDSTGRVSSTAMFTDAPELLKLIETEQHATRNISDRLNSEKLGVLGGTLYSIATTDIMPAVSKVFNDQSGATTLPAELTVGLSTSISNLNAWVKQDNLGISSDEHKEAIVTKAYQAVLLAECLPNQLFEAIASNNTPVGQEQALAQFFDMVEPLPQDLQSRACWLVFELNKHKPAIGNCYDKMSLGLMELKKNAYPDGPTL